MCPCGFALERNLGAGEEGLLVFAIGAVGGTFVERGVRVGGDELQVLGEVPVEADAPRLGAARGVRGIGEQREGVVIDIECSVARDQFQRAPACRTARKRLVRPAASNTWKTPPGSSAAVGC